MTVLGLVGHGRLQASDRLVGHAGGVEGAAHRIEQSCGLGFGDAMVDGEVPGNLVEDLLAPARVVQFSLGHA